MIYIVKRIDEDLDFGCEERSEDAPVMAVVILVDSSGEELRVKAEDAIPQGEDHFKTRVLVSVSPQFFGWVTGIGSGMKITGPDNVKAEYKAYLQDVLENY